MANQLWWRISVFVCFSLPSAHATSLTINYTNEVKRLPRFWKNTGFAPPDPLDKAGTFFESNDVNLNLEIIGSLPNNGIKNIRIHWLLNFLSISGYDENMPIYDFKRLDSFLDKLTFEYDLKPTIEFMTTRKFKKIDGLLWQNLSFQIASRYLERYGANRLSNWKFETWNEPDLKSYNALNFTLIQYLDYVHGIKEGLKAVNRQYSDASLKLRGPAGLFKDKLKHPFCWKILETCNKNLTHCPIDIITFHRKGNGIEANEILEGGLDLVNKFSQEFPHLAEFKLSNTEADPIKKWSEARDFQSDSRYAAILVETILQHWKAIYDGRMKNLESISHDNSFLNFYPNIFTQRTLLSRFQMNNTTPSHVQFIEKPVYAALGLTSYLGEFASTMKTSKNISYVISTNGNKSDKFYACILVTSHVNLHQYVSRTKKYEIIIDNIPNRNDLFYFAEGIDNKKTNPSQIFEAAGKPAYPESRLFSEMRKAQIPIIIEQPTTIVNGKLILNSNLMNPFVVVIRICSSNVNAPKKVYNLRIRKINEQEIMLFWSDKVYKKRCIKTYEIFFKYQDSFIQIDTGHIPFQHKQLKHTIPGCFKIRSMDFFNRFSEMSEKICYNV